MEIGDKLRSARLQLHLTQKDVANKIGLSHNSVSDWENNKTQPNVDYLGDLCNILAISPDELLGINSLNPQDELMELRQQLRQRPEIKKLFSLSKKATKEDIEFVTQMLERMVKDSNNE